MIKRRFYKQDHGDKTASDDDDSSSSSGSSDADAPPSATTNEEVEEVEEEGEAQSSPSLGSGYESEDSSSKNLEGDCASGENPEDKELNNVVKDKESEESLARTGVDMPREIQADFESFVLKCKSVFKCRICPRIVCLTEETIKTHLKSKRHTRSKKLFGEGRLKLMLNSDGEIEDEGETHAERHARTVNLLKKDLNAPKAKDSGRQRQRRRQKRSSRGHSDKVKKEKNNQKHTTKRQKMTEDIKSSLGISSQPSI